MTDSQIIKSEFFKIPNLLTCSRIAIAVAIFVITIFDRGLDSVKWLFLIGVATDSLDGFFARRTGQVSKLGVVLEPIADTLLVMMTVLFVTVRSDLHWMIFAAYMAILLIGILNLLAIYLSAGRWFAKKLEISEVAIFFIYATGIFYLFVLPYREWLAIASICIGIIALSDFLWQLHKFNQSIKSRK